MATKKKAATETPSAKKDIFDIFSKVETDLGMKHIDLSENIQPVNSGVLTLDLILGGGIFPGRVMQIFGAESSGKSTLAYTIAAALQRHNVMTAFADHEGTTDKAYIKRLGFDTSNTNRRFKYMQPSTGEETYTLWLRILEALDDCHEGIPQICFLLDSIAKMPSEKALALDSKMPALNASMHSKYLNLLKTKFAQKHAVVIGINQIRTNVGQMYGSPEVTPGGKAWAFDTDTMIRVGKGKPVEVNGYVYQPMRLKTVKNKNFQSMQEAEIHLKLGYGIDPASDVISFCKLTGFLQKKGKLPLLEGLNKYCEKGQDVDGVYESAAALEATIRSQVEHKQATIWNACLAALRAGDATNLYLAKKREEGEAAPMAAATEPTEDEAEEETNEE